MMEEKKELPFITIITGILNEEKHIRNYLESAVKQDYPENKFEIIIVDGGSSDKSVDIVRDFTEKYRNIILISGLGKLNLPQSLNIAIREAQGELISKVDAHGFISSDFLKTNAKYLSEDEKIGCTGGPIIPIAENIIAKANAYARSSIFGVGRGIYSAEEKPQFVETVQCGTYKKAILNEIGLFDESLQFGEDEEINWRLIKAGYKIFLTPEVKFFYYPRDSFRKLFKQYYNYGVGRVRVLRKYPDFLRTKHLIPSLFILSIFLSVLLALFNTFSLLLLIIILASYSISSLFFSALISLKKGWIYFIFLPFSFACLHFGYGTGLLGEIFNNIFKKN